MVNSSWTVHAAVLVLAAISGCSSPDQSERRTPLSPPSLSEYKRRYFGPTPVWLVRLDEGLEATGSVASGLSDDGKVVCGEVYNPSATGRHGRGTYWTMSQSVPPVWIRSEIPYLPFPSKDNPAFGVSADGNVVAGANTLDGSAGPVATGADTLGYATIGGVHTFYHLRFLSQSGQVSVQARASDDSGQRIVGFGCTNTDVYKNPCTAMLWAPGISGPWTPREIDTLPDKPPSSRSYDTNAAGTAIVGEGASPAALAVYADAGLAQEAVLWTTLYGAPHIQRTWLGFAPGSARNHSVAYGISSDSSAANGFVIVGASGGNSYSSEADGLDARPTKWRVNAGVVTADALPLLTASQYVPRDMVTGRALAVSRGGGVTVGTCGRKVSEDTWDSEAVIWGWDPNRPRSIREILLQHGVLDVADLRLESAAGVSEDGLSVCGYGSLEDDRLFAWVARLPPYVDPGFVVLPPFLRRLPNIPWHPLLR